MNLPSCTLSLVRRAPLFALAVLAAGLMDLRVASAAAPPPAKESQLKAAFVYNFLKFVEWPAQSFANSDSPLVVGVAGHAPMLGVLEAAVKARKVNGHPILVRLVERPADAGAVHALFIPAAEDSQLEAWLRLPAASGVLTIGESEAFGARGGIITFVLEGDKMRFNIDMVSADQAGLKISAQLQKLARSVRSKKQPGP